MPADKYITGSITIRQGAVFKDNKKLFEDKSKDAAGFLLSVYQYFWMNYPKFYKMDNLSKLGWLASEILLKDSFDIKNYQSEEVGLILSNSNSSLDNDIKYFETVKEVASPSLFVYTLPNIVIGEICIRNNFKGEHAFYILDKFDADFIAGQADYLLDNNILQACICGWVDFLGQEYEAGLFLVENQKNKSDVLFSAENMSGIFNRGRGLK